jgi:hypothetical protein
MILDNLPSGSLFQVSASIRVSDEDCSHDATHISIKSNRNCRRKYRFTLDMNSGKCLFVILSPILHDLDHSDDCACANSHHCSAAFNIWGNLAACGNRRRMRCSKSRPSLNLQILVDATALSLLFACILDTAISPLAICIRKSHSN